MIDDVVVGRYKIESQIGSGGMGIVYRAVDIKLRRPVALKVIAPHLVEDEEARARFLREAQALAGLSHPNIVTVFDLAEEQETGRVFIVMEFLNGLPLRKHITNPARPPFYDMAMQVCRALEHAHENGVLHRDIKPENIFVCTDGTVKLMDFGLARLVDGATVNSSGLVTGTVAYMSPEQLRGGALDPRADLYGLGVLFYEYICGFTPFSSESPGTMLLKHLTEIPPSLQTKVPGTSPELDALILQLLAKDPGSRYPSAAILRDALERVRSRAATGAIPIAAPKLAGPPMPATLVPLVAPRPSRPRTMPMPPASARQNFEPLRPEFKNAAIVAIVVLGGLLAFAFQEALHQALASTPQPPKKAVHASGDRARSNPPAGTASQRLKKRRRGARGTSSEDANTADAHAPLSADGAAVGESTPPAERASDSGSEDGQPASPPEAPSSAGASRADSSG